MKKTPQQTPAETSGGNDLKKPRIVYFTDEVWNALRANGNATKALNLLCEKAGYGKKESQSKT